MLLEAFSSEDQERFLENMNKRLQLCEKNKEKMLKLFLDMNYYAPCSLPSYLKKIGLALSSDIPERKSIAFKDFIKHITRLNSSKLTNPEKKQLKIWFSDDSLSNLDAVESTIQNELIHDYPDIIFSVYNTNIPHIIKKISYANQKITLKK